MPVCGSLGAADNRRLHTSMSLIVFAVVMSAAVLHASWNAIVKSASDKFLTTVLVTTSAAALSAVSLPFLTAPARASWTYAPASAVFHLIYFLLVARTYDIADMSQTYPLMRGTAPLIVALVSVPVLGEVLSPIAWAGIIAVCFGIVSIAFGNKANDRKGVYLALLNAVVIAAYTLLDGIGVRQSGAPAAYTLWVFLLTGVPLAVWASAAAGNRFFSYGRHHWRLGLAGGCATTAAYGVVLWAMTVAPVAVVAALRESSILFGTLIAGFVLKEHVGSRRVISAGIIAGGAILLRLA